MILYIYKFETSYLFFLSRTEFRTRAARVMQVDVARVTILAGSPHSTADGQCQTVIYMVSGTALLRECDSFHFYMNAIRTQYEIHEGKILQLLKVPYYAEFTLTMSESVSCLSVFLEFYRTFWIINHTGVVYKW